MTKDKLADKPKTKMPFISEGIFLAFASVATYIATYAWEVGYSSFFRIPNELINISLQSALKIGALLFVGIPAVIYLWDLTALHLRKVDSSRREYRLRVTIFVALFAPGLVVPLIFGAPAKQFVQWLMPSLIYLVFWIILPLIIYRHETMEERWAEDDKVDQSFEAPARLMSNPIGLGIFTLFVLAYFFYQSGATWAMSKKDFLVIEQERIVVMAKYGDYFVTAPFDLNSHKIAPNFQLVSFSDMKCKKLTIARVGPFTTREKSIERSRNKSE